MKYAVIFITLLVLWCMLIANKQCGYKCSQLESKLIKANNTIDSINKALDGAVIIYKEK